MAINIRTALLVAGILAATLAVGWAATIVRRSPTPISRVSPTSGSLDRREHDRSRAEHSLEFDQNSSSRRGFLVDVKPQDVSETESDSSSARAEVRKRQDEVEFEMLIARHREQPRDSAWSDEFESALGLQLGAVGDSLGFSTTAIDCRTDSCLATLEWETHSDAVLRWQGVLRQRFPCAVGILLPDPDGRDQVEKPYRHHVVYERCDRTIARAQSGPPE